ncbi:MAG: DUF305 domain-containing protein [Anaerolineales bacterium]
MTETSLPDEIPAPQDAQGFNWQKFLSVAALIILAALLGFWLGTRQIFGPGEDSPEVGFARDMLMHHAQAVDMATILRDRTEDPEMRQLALDIMLTQQAQIGQIQGWLAVWRYPVASTGPAMAWMGMPTTGLMPGMATPEQINQLRALTGVEADGLFLQLMILHHRGGVVMGQAALELTQRPEVRALAQAIVNAQTIEIAAMQALLERKGFPPVPDDVPTMDHENMSP